MKFRLQVLSDQDMPEPILVDVVEMASGPHYQALGVCINKLVEEREGMVTIEVERVQ